jgi:hypothetical protein
VWRGENGAEDWEEGRRAGLLDTGFEEVGRLQEDRGAEAGEEAGEEVEGWMGFGGELGLGF